MEQVDVPYFDCLFLSDTATRPSMSLSSSPKDWESFAAMIEFARSIAGQAAAEAVQEGSSAYFEVGGEGE